MTDRARSPEYKTRPWRRLTGKLAAGAAFASGGILHEVVPVFGSAILNVRMKTATQGGDLVVEFVGPDFLPGFDSSLASVNIDPTSTDNKVTWTARKAGIEGEKITIQYRDPAAASQSLSVTVTGNAIVVNLATNGGSTITSTAGEIITAVAASAAASALVSGANYAGNDGTGVVTAISATALAIAYASLVGTKYTTGDVTDSVSAGTEMMLQAPCFGDGYAIIKFTGGGTGTVTFCDIAYLKSQSGTATVVGEIQVDTDALEALVQDVLDATVRATVFEAITKSDTVGFSGNSRLGIYVGGAGDVAVVLVDDSVVLFTAVPAGATLPVIAKRVNSANTTATAMVALL